MSPARVVLLLVLAAAFCAAAPANAALPPSIGALESQLARGTTTCQAVTQQALAAIQAGSSLRAVLEVNPDAMAIAQQLDAEQAAGSPLRPLQCLPLLVKDNYQTGDQLHTTAGSLTLKGYRAPVDALVVSRLRAAGAVVLAKTNMDEWAHGPVGYSSIGGQTLNALRSTRRPGGSSGGSAVGVASGMGLVGTGSDTGGSIQIPANYNGVVGLKPTLGLISRAGIVPFSSVTDVPGPLARNVEDIAQVLGFLTGVDPADPDTRASKGHSLTDYTSFLAANGLRGARIGVLKSTLGTPMQGYNADSDRRFNAALRVMRAQGAKVVTLPDLKAPKLRIPKDLFAIERHFKPELDAWFKANPGTPVHSLRQVVALSSRPPLRSKVKILDKLKVALGLGPPSGSEYRRELAGLHSLRTAALNMYRRYRLDAIVFETGGCSAPPLPGIVDRTYRCKDVKQPLKFNGGGGSPGVILPPITGFPALTLPTGLLPGGLRGSLNLMGRPWSEGPLLRMGYAFEQATK